MKKDVENINITTGNPVGTIISFYGKTAPEGYLVCDEEIYNREDYPELAEHLVTNFEDLIGDGETTFKVPDLRGEFLRGTGTNSHADGGNGDAVGVHQTPTTIPWVLGNLSSTINMYFSGNSVRPQNIDKGVQATSRAAYNRASSATDGLSGVSSTFSLRPTNTSILYCIKYQL